MAERLRIVLEFKKSSRADLELYSRLLAFDSPSALIKNILKGLIPVDVLDGFEDDEED